MGLAMGTQKCVGLIPIPPHIPHPTVLVLGLTPIPSAPTPQLWGQSHPSEPTPRVLCQTPIPPILTPQLLGLIPFPLPHTPQFWVVSLSTHPTPRESCGYFSSPCPGPPQFWVRSQTSALHPASFGADSFPSHPTPQVLGSIPFLVAPPPFMGPDPT